MVVYRGVRYYAPGDAARRMGLSPHALAMRLRRGLIRTVMVPVRKRMIAESEIARCLNTGSLNERNKG